jgi:hypothetical protein
LIEKQVFARPEFIKKVPVLERPNYLADHIGRVGGTYVATDYSSFEALFVKELMACVEMELYSYMVEHLPDGRDWLSEIKTTLLGKNVCKFKNFRMEVESTRMSGEMCTSLGNSFSNLMFMLFVCQEVGSQNVCGVVEGDDGLFVVEGPIPTSSDFETIGLKIKMERHEKLECASFCGLVFDLVERTVICNPLKVLLSTGWTTGKYVRASHTTLRHLARAKAFSIAYQYSGCPVVSSYANYILRSTRDLGPIDISLRKSMRNMGVWERERAISLLAKDDVPNKPVGPHTRHLVYEKFGIPVDEQIKAEEMFDGMSCLGPFILPWDALLHPDVFAYSSGYIQDVPPSEFDYPALSWASDPSAWAGLVGLLKKS